MIGDSDLCCSDGIDFLRFGRRAKSKRLVQGTKILKKTMSFSIGFYEMDDPGINPRPDGGWVVLWQWGILVKRGPLESEVEYNVLLHRIPVPFMRNCVFFGGYRVISDLYKLYPLQAVWMEFHLGRFELIV